MRAGLLRHRVRIETRVQAQDAYGQPVQDWAEVTTVWASVEPVSGREYWAAQQAQAEVTHRVVMRARELSPAMRLVHRGRVLEVVAVRDIEERGRRIEVLTRERVT